MTKTNLLVIGSGGREHALCWALKRSANTGMLYCAPGNAGIAEEAECIALKTHADIIAFCQSNGIGLVVVGPEAPLVEGLADALNAAAIPVFGPSAKAAQLEGSKGFTKNLCEKYGIPTAASQQFTKVAAAKAYIETHSTPIVVKADGLAAGKGVIIAETREDAIAAVEDMLSGNAFGEAGARVVIEAFMEGEELSFFALANGKTTLAFGSAQDHKRVGEGDTGPNTGGMGTYAPAPVLDAALEQRIMQEIIQPTAEAMVAEGMPYCGVLFAGLMITRDGPKLIEYNARFGDPETQVLMRRLDSDLLELLLATATGQLAGKSVRMKSEAAMCVVMAAKGYPGAYKKGSVIGRLNEANALPGVTVFHAGTAEQDGNIIATGGRVLGVTATGETIQQARERAYKAVDAIDWPQGFCRRDIGWRALGKSRAA